MESQTLEPILYGVAKYLQPLRGDDPTENAALTKMQLTSKTVNTRLQQENFLRWQVMQILPLGLVDKLYAESKQDYSTLSEYEFLSALVMCFVFTLNRRVHPWTPDSYVLIGADEIRVFLPIGKYIEMKLRSFLERSRAFEIRENFGSELAKNVAHKHAASNHRKHQNSRFTERRR